MEDEKRKGKSVGYQHDLNIWPLGHQSLIRFTIYNKYSWNYLSQLANRPFARPGHMTYPPKTWHFVSTRNKKSRKK